MRRQADTVVRNRDADRAIATARARHFDLLGLRVLADVGEELANRPVNDLADFRAETRVALVEADLAGDVALSPEFVAELEEARMKLSAGRAGHRRAREEPPRIPV